MKRKPIVGPLKEAEDEIDSFYKTIQITNGHFEQALWGYLSYLEMVTFFQNPDRVLGDLLVNSSKWAVRWIHKNCKLNGKLEKEYVYHQAREIQTLAEDYLHFETAYVLARMGMKEIEVKDGFLSQDFSEDDLICQAYEILEDRNVAQENLVDIIQANEDILNLGTLRNPSGRMITPQNVAIVKEVLRSSASKTYSLPDDWVFSIGPISEFREIFISLQAIATLHHLWSEIAYRKQPSRESLFANLLFLTGSEELTTRLQRYTNLNKETIERFCGILTYGRFNQRNPDPALQPIIKVAEDLYALSYVLLINSNFERNLITLLNRNETTRGEYTKISSFRQTRQIANIREATKLKTYSGRILGKSELPDIDLAVIDLENRCLLLCELKSFAHPAEPREVVEKTIEIQKGILQASKLLNHFTQEPALLKALELNEGIGFDIQAVVVAENFIGEPYLLSKDIPVILTTHLARLLKQENLPTIISTLRERSYLPELGKDFEIVEHISKIGNVRIKWLGANLKD